MRTYCRDGDLIAPEWKAQAKVLLQYRYYVHDLFCRLFPIRFSSPSLVAVTVDVSRGSFRRGTGRQSRIGTDKNTIISLVSPQRYRFVLRTLFTERYEILRQKEKLRRIPFRPGFLERVKDKTRNPYRAELVAPESLAKVVSLPVKSNANTFGERAMVATLKENTTEIAEKREKITGPSYRSDCRSGWPLSKFGKNIVERRDQCRLTFLNVNVSRTSTTAIDPTSFIAFVDPNHQLAPDLDCNFSIHPFAIKLIV